jgi:peptide/nickel transport system substrate-binding protein
VEIINKYEGKIILSEYQATLWTTTLPLSSGLIICKKQVEEIGLEKFATDVVGTGPYVLEEWRPTEQVTLKSNPDYWGETPVWDEIQLFPISDDNAAELALEADEVDFSRIPLISAERFEGNASFGVTTIPTNSYAWLGMNIENPKLKDINVRQAIRYGIDVPSILEAAYEGKAKQARAMIPEGTLGYWEDAPLYERDVEKSRKYLAAAGLESLELELAIESTDEYRAWAEVIQQNLAEVGITITISSLDEATFWSIGEGDKGLDVELFALTFTAMQDPAWFAMWFTSDQVGVWNWMRWASPEYDALYKKGLSTVDEGERTSIYIEMQKLWDASANSVWITNQPKSYAYKPSIEPVLYYGGNVPMLREFKPAA